MSVPTVKDLSPNVTLVLPLGIVNDIPSDDLKLTSLFFRSLIYGGTPPCIALNVKRNALIGSNVNQAITSSVQFA